MKLFYSIMESEINRITCRSQDDIKRYAEQTGMSVLPQMNGQTFLSVRLVQYHFDQYKQIKMGLGLVLV